MGFVAILATFWDLKRKLDRKGRFSKAKLAVNPFWMILFQVFIFGFLTFFGYFLIIFGQKDDKQKTFRN